MNENKTIEKMTEWNLQEWGRQLMLEVKAKWQEYPMLKGPGCAVFYSPIHMNPDLMIIGFNPGGGNDDFCLERDCDIPLEHGYINQDYSIAVKMRELFNRIGHLHMLEDSVKLNLIFFRSHNTDEWNKIERATRYQLEIFCQEKVKNIISILLPKVILAEGIGTYRILKNLIFDNGGNGKETSVKNGSKNLLLSTGSKMVKLIGIRHPTGSRPPLSKEEWNQIDHGLSELLK